MIFYLVLFISVTADAWRDAWINRDWLARHVPKWVSLYLPMIYILYLNGYFVAGKLIDLTVLAVFSFVWWRIIYTSMEKY